ncbi:MAG: hypothetical protein KKC18_05575 [Chloroflexi bacterium]|nr:hypothetical protein [Chloroflexota bacterium]
MPECIVCKGYYDPDDPKTKTECRRCGSDNIDWEEWRKNKPVEQEGLRGLFHFTGPHCHLPFLIILVAAALGLMGMGIKELWKEVNLFACLLAVVVSVGLSLLTLLWVYVRRHKLREEYLLERVKTAVSDSKPKKIPETPYVKVESRFAFVPGVIVVLVILLACVLVWFEIPWKLSEILFIEKTPTSTPTPTPTPTTTLEPIETPAETGLREKVKRAVPLIFLSGYVGLFPALVYSSSILLVQEYTRRMSQEIPQPIFLQDERLARVVRKEAELLLGREKPPEQNNEAWAKCKQEKELQQEARHRLLTPSVSSPGKDLIVLEIHEHLAESANWTWEEMERTGDGGVRFKAIKYIIRRRLPPDSSKAETYTQTQYIVTADPWGRITEIKRADK